MRILITGALGRIGGPLTAALTAQGHDVTAVYRRQPTTTAIPAGSGAAYVNADAFDTDAMAPHLQNQDAVIHLACSSVIESSEADMIGDIHRNLVGTVALLRACQEARVKTFIFPSSGGAVYGDHPVIPTRECDLPNPISYHAAMKLSTEHYLHAAAKYGVTRPVILRITNPYGLGAARRNQGIIDVFIAHLKANQAIEIWGDVTIARDFLHIDDLTAAFSAVLNAKQPGPLYNIGSGTATSLKQILAILGQRFDLTDKVDYRPARKVDVRCSAVDPQKAREELGWSAKIPLAEGIAGLIDG